MIYALFVASSIFRDLRAFGGTSLDHKFLVGGPKSIYTAGPVVFHPGYGAELAHFEPTSLVFFPLIQQYIQ